MADFFTGLPQLIATSGILGAGGEHIAQSAHNHAQTSLSKSQPQIPLNTTSSSTGTPATPSSQPSQTTVKNSQPSSTPPSSSGSGSGQQSSTTASNSQPSQTPAAALPVPTFEEAGTAKQTIDKLKAQNSPLSPDQQQTLDAAEKTFARRTEQNILNQQAGIEKRGGKLHPTTAKALQEAQATLARPRPEGNTDIVGTPGKTTSSTASSSSPLPPADTATTQGVTPPVGTSTGTRTSTANTDGTSVTASSGDSTAPGGSTHTTNGVAPPPVGHGNRIPEDTTHPEHIDLAKKRVENLGKIAAKRKLDPHEQGIYDNALRVRDRNTPAQPGDRNTNYPQDLVMADGDGPINKSQSAAADAPPPAAPAQPANSIGATINGPSKANPDTPHASASDGLGSSSQPAASQQQPTPQGGRPTNGGASSNGQPPLAPPASTQASTSSGLPQSGTAPAVPHHLGSPTEHTDPRLKETFKNWPHGWDEQGFPQFPRTLLDDHKLVTQITDKKKVVRLPADHPLVAAGVLPAGQDIPRKFLHDAIVNHLIRQATPLPADATPTVYALGGGGGAGKSSLFKKLMNEGLADARNVVHVDADEIKKYIPEYEEIRAKGDGRAASMAQLESARIADRLLKKLMDPNAPNYHIAYDSTMANATANLDRIDDWKAAGKRVHLIGVTIDPKEAAVRAAIRALEEGRWVPSEALAKAHEGFNQALPYYLPQVDAADIFDNNGAEPRIIAKK